MIFVGAIEFLCAQIPYSMKGVIVGLYYCFDGGILFVWSRDDYLFLKLLLHRGVMMLCLDVNFGTCKQN